MLKKFIFSATAKGSIYSSESISNGILKDVRVEGQDVVTWCTVSALEQEKCEKLMRTAMQDKGLFGKDYIDLRCIRVSY